MHLVDARACLKAAVEDHLAQRRGQLLAQIGSVSAAAIKLHTVYSKFLGGFCQDARRSHRESSSIASRGLLRRMWNSCAKFQSG
jgi:hypothetical protein